MNGIQDGHICPHVAVKSVFFFFPIAKLYDHTLRMDVSTCASVF